jgi:hypothetical protein
MVTFTAEEIVEALYQGILNRPPDPDGRDIHLRRLAEDRGLLTSFIVNFVTSPERFNAEAAKQDILEAVFRAALGRAPDAEETESYGPLLQKNFGEGLREVARSVYASAEHQDRLLPPDADRVLVDHSPNGEFRVLLRQWLAGSGGRGVVVEVGATRPEASLALDLAKALNWRAVLVEGDAKQWRAIESRFSGANFDLIKAHVLAPSSPEAAGGAKVRALGLTAAAPTALTPLGPLLDKAGVPDAFDVLTLGGAANTMDVLDELLLSSSFRPKTIIVATPIQLEALTLRQYGLGEAACGLYEVFATTDRSVLLKATA